MTRTSDTSTRFTGIDRHILEINPVQPDGAKSVVFMCGIEGRVPSRGWFGRLRWKMVEY
jgi:hypothetical protein